jgi:chromate transport protein ChrA
VHFLAVGGADVRCYGVVAVAAPTTWLAPVQRGFGAVALGLTAAGAYSIVRVTITDWTMLGIAAGAFMLLWKWRSPPALVILLGGLAALAIGVVGRA